MKEVRTLVYGSPTVVAVKYTAKHVASFPWCQVREIVDNVSDATPSVWEIRQYGLHQS